MPDLAVFPKDIQYLKPSSIQRHILLLPLWCSLCKDLANQVTY